MKKKSLVIQRSESIRELIGEIPGFWLHWGSGLLFALVLLFLVAGAFIQYPDVLEAQISIVAQDPPLRVITRSGGEIERIFVQDKQAVEKGSELAVIKNASHYADVAVLRRQLHLFRQHMARPESLRPGDFEQGLVLGDLQAPYSEFIQNAKNLHFFLTDSAYPHKIRTMENQEADFIRVAALKKQQREVLTKEYEITSGKYEKYEVLFRQGLISEEALRNVELELLRSKLSLQNAENDLAGNEIQLKDYYRNLNEIRQEYREKRRTLEQTLLEAGKNLQSRLAVWEETYLLTAPTAGRVSFFKYWSPNQFVTAGDEIMAVVPASGGVRGRIQLPNTGAGKVRRGQKVIIEFVDYPATEFGMVEGRVETISLLAKDNQYLVTVLLDQGLKTSYGKVLEFRQEMLGNAQIVTEDLSILQRLFNNLRLLLGKARR